MFELIEHEDGTITVQVLAPVNDNMRLDDGDPHLISADDNVIPFLSGK